MFRSEEQGLYLDGFQTTLVFMSLATRRQHDIIEQCQAEHDELFVYLIYPSLSLMRLI